MTFEPVTPMYLGDLVYYVVDPAYFTIQALTRYALLYTSSRLLMYKNAEGWTGYRDFSRIFSTLPQCVKKKNR